MNTGLLADVLPPPPNLPLVGVAIPHPILVVIIGCCFAAAFWMLGRKLAGEKGVPTWAKAAALTVAVLTLVGTIWTTRQWAEYAKVRWRSHGPVLPELIVPMDEMHDEELHDKKLHDDLSAQDDLSISEGVLGESG